MRKYLFLVLLLGWSRLGWTQQEVSLGLGLGNLTKSVVGAFVTDNQSTYLALDASLRFLQPKLFTAYLEYSVFVDNNTTGSYLNHQPKIKFLFLTTPDNPKSNAVGLTLATNIGSEQHLFVWNDTYGNKLVRKFNISYVAYKAGLAHHFTFRYNRLILIIENELGILLNSDITENNSYYIPGFGLPMGESGFYFNIDFELYYALHKTVGNQQGKPQGKKEYQFN
jgi:hypothetical protein